MSKNISVKNKHISRGQRRKYKVIKRKKKKEIADRKRYIKNMEKFNDIILKEYKFDSFDSCDLFAPVDTLIGFLGDDRKAFVIVAQKYFKLFDTKEEADKLIEKVHFKFGKEFSDMVEYYAHKK